jgi:CysZ protein
LAEIDRAAAVGRLSALRCAIPSATQGNQPFGRLFLQHFVARAFAILSILVNILILLLTLFTGIGFASFFLLNGYLLGREYFELAAMRHCAPSEAVALRRRHSGQVYLAGVIISGIVAVPVLNLLTPLFATAFMTRLHKRLA